MEEQIVNNFLDLHDNVKDSIINIYLTNLQDVKTVHSNQNMIEKDLQILYKENEKLVNHTKAAITLYDDFLEILKVCQCKFICIGNRRCGKLVYNVGKRYEFNS